MALRNAVLAALLEGEASGYDMAKRFDASVANFWITSPQQLYRELERMEVDGLIAARVVQQERRPNKRLFTLTDAGRRELHAFTAEPAKPAALRDDLLIKVQAVDAGDPRAVRAAVRERLEWARAKLARYDRLRARLLDNRTEEEFLVRSDRVGPYLTLMGGRSLEQATIRWCESTLAILDRRAAAPAGPSDGPGGSSAPKA
ncbi:PadR family transcriptional regulator [Umezawaea sp. Da 62-37]|uniref:PadR family transcriptional regulator n=1 Tax=Umezawaea sp. Da 62-37 TaxID=3075927 RepID=UPI0028F6C624|nr:PadR family transcriptional regulator [Umezawaea sp. Da 62-37]WNV87337.1 PadR family transcriptional regulator [Umezawaea sp. Da 62-37]